MWGAALFFITILMATPGGRAAVCQYAQQAIDLFAAQLPYSDVAFVLMTLSALGCLLIIRGGRTPERPVERWIWREIRVLETDPVASRKLNRRSSWRPTARH
jgi:hypothetical protein